MAAPDLSTLTPAQREVHALLTMGYCNKNIGRHLNISAGTVKNHVSEILAKLGTPTRAQCIVAFYNPGGLNAYPPQE